MDRTILLNSLNSKSTETNRLNPMTTVFYPDNQISSYQRHRVPITTPTPTDKHISSDTLLTPLLKRESTNRVTSTAESYPTNHKQKFSSVYRKRVNGFESNKIGVDRSLSPPLPPTKATEMLLPSTFLPDDYVPSYRNVNNIQDILNQNSNENKNNYGNAPVQPAIPFTPVPTIESNFRRAKMANDQLTTMETIQNGQIRISPNAHKFKPFLKFIPSSPSDVNLLATDMVKTKPYTHHKPRPLTTTTTIDKLPNHLSRPDPNLINQQMISDDFKNYDGFKPSETFGKTLKMNTKSPIKVMLEPMRKDQKSIRYSHRDPTSFHPLNVNQIPFIKETPFYGTFRAPQLQFYPTYVMNPTPNEEEFVRDYEIHQMNEDDFMPVLKPSQILSYETSPNELIYQLNLYPDRKRIPTRNVEIVDSDFKLPDSASFGEEVLSIT